jgi:hypothetical protein
VWGITGSLVLVLAVYRALSLLLSMASIVTDDEVFAQFKEDSRKQYKWMWLQFRDYLPQLNFESGHLERILWSISSNICG